MPIAARFVGLMWMGIVAVLSLVQGLREAFLSAPRLFFDSGSGELMVAAAAFAAGYILWKWGRHAEGRGGA